MATFSLLILFTTALQSSITPIAESQLVSTPPKLVLESNRIVWYQIPSSGPINKFDLKCQASGDSIQYSWTKNNQEYLPDNDRIIWQRSGQSGTLVFVRPDLSDQGLYQCKASNIFGTALSNIFQVRLGTLEHFQNQPVREIIVNQGEPLTLPCVGPHGVPKPTMFWLFRNTKQSFVIETIDREHITVDGDGNLRFSHVEKHDARENLLYQCAATSPVLHGEYRAGGEIRLTVKDALLIEMEPKIMWVSPSRVAVTAGETLKLTCIFSGYPTPKVKWSKKSQTLPVDRILQENFGKTLLIRPTYAQDEGIYVCQVGSIVHEMFVEVLSAPQWRKEAPQNFDLAEDDDVEINCDSMGEPSPEVQWLKNGIPLSSISDSNKRYLILDNGKKLKIRKLQHKHDKAVYQCNASNHLGYIYANAFLNVKAHAPIFLTPINQVIRAVVGSTADLDCSVDSAPLATIRWTDSRFNAIIPVEGKRKLLPNGSLRIVELKTTDADTYICHVTNKFGVNQARRSLEVYKPTFFMLLLDPSERFLTAGDKLELACLANSDERIKMEYFWTKDGKTLAPDSLPEGLRFIGTNRLILESVKGRDSGTYKCSVKTLVDEISTKMKLRVKDIPEAPIITSIKCRETQALISWTPAFENHGKIREYLIEYSTEFEPNKWKVGLVQNNRENSTLYETVISLNPWVNYTFRVSAVNLLGKGQSGYMSHVTCRTPPALPYLNPKNLTTDSSRKDNMIIRWQPLSKEQWGASNISYLLSYKLENSNEDWRMILIDNPDQNHLEIEGLPTYQKFRVQIRSINAQGTCPIEPESISGFSGEDVPARAPENFKIQFFNSTNSIFTWTPVDEKYINGKLMGYFIRVWRMSDNANNNNIRKRSISIDNYLWELKVSAEESTATVTDLKPMFNYAANIMVANAKFNSTTSDVVKFSTPEGPPGPVSNLEVESYGAHSILCTWNQPEENLGNITVYRLEFHEEDKEKRSKNVYDSAVAAETLHYLHDTLKPANFYTIFIWAVTGGGAGPKSKRRVKTFSRQSPGKPDFDIQSFEPKSVIIKWTPSKDQLPGTSFHVNYSLDTSDSKETRWQKSQTILLPEFYMSIGDLTPENQYKFVLYANDGELSTASDVKRFKTLATYSYQKRAADENIASASWFIATVSALCIFFVTTISVCVCKANKGEKYPVKKKEMERGHSFDHDEEKSFMEYQYGSASSRTSDSPADL